MLMEDQVLDGCRFFFYQQLAIQGSIWLEGLGISGRYTLKNYNSFKLSCLASLSVICIKGRYAKRPPI